MIPLTDLVEKYQAQIKRIKFFAVAGQLCILLIRLFSQRLFSLYIGIVVIQIILILTIYLKNRSEFEAKMYIIMNFVLLYLLIINFLETYHSQQNVIQFAFKQNYIVNYVKIGYPIQAGFRIISTLIVWRFYQFSMLKDDENGHFLSTEEHEQQNRHDRIHIRQNVDRQGLQWNLNFLGQSSENQRNLQNSSHLSRNRSSNVSISGTNTNRLNNINNPSEPSSSNNQNIRTHMNNMNNRQDLSNRFNQNSIQPNYNAEINYRRVSSIPQNNMLFHQNQNTNPLPQQIPLNSYNQNTQNRPV